MNYKETEGSCFILVAPSSEYQYKTIHYSLRYKLLLKYARNYYIWSRRLKDTNKICTGLAFLDHRVYLQRVRKK